jgi:hypothetical protein
MEENIFCFKNWFIWTNSQSFLKDKKQNSEQIDEMIAKKWVKSLSSALKYLHKSVITDGNIVFKCVVIKSRGPQKF